MRMIPGVLIVGHLTEDMEASGPRLGGAAAYAGVLASRFGVPATILTAADADFPFEVEGCRVIRFPSPDRTRFQNRYRDGRRRQRMPSVAAPIPQARVREAVRELPPGAGVLYAPVASELDGAWTFPRPADGLAGLLPQGLLRSVGPDGAVRIAWPPGLAARLRPLDLVSLSREELPAFPLDVRLLAITDGKRGAELLPRGRAPLAVPPVSATERDPTGAGDVFGAALFLGILEGKPLGEAGRFAAAAAALAVEAPGLSGAPDRKAVETRLSSRASGGRADSPGRR